MYIFLVIIIAVIAAAVLLILQLPLFFLSTAAVPIIAALIIAALRRKSLGNAGIIYGTIYKKRTVRHVKERSLCVSVWSASTQQFCDNIPYTEKGTNEFRSLEPGDAVIVYRIKNTLAATAVPFELKKYMR